MISRPLLKIYCDQLKSGVSTDLNGIFAFAILDLSLETLFIARDSLGVKPLYFSSEGNIFCFASEIKALFELNSINKEVDLEAINRYLAFLWCPGEGTPIRSVKKLAPGEALIVKSGEIVKQTFSGTGSQATFALSDTIEDIDNISVYVSGVYQYPSNYTVSGANVIFAKEPVNAVFKLSTPSV